MFISTVFQVTWYKEEETVKESERITLRFEGDHCSLDIRDTQPTDSGLYTAKASNTFGEAINFCRLNVQPAMRAAPPPTPPKPRPIPVAPSFLPPLANQNLQEGQRCLFQVLVGVLESSSLFPVSGLEVFSNQIYK